MIEVEIIAEFDTMEAAQKFASDAEECIGKNNGEFILGNIGDSIGDYDSVTDRAERECDD